MSVRRKLLVTGASGFVAGSVLAQAGERWELHAVSRRLQAALVPALHWHACDALAAAPLLQLLRSIQPEVIIHTAASADIDFCENNREAARVANVDLTRRLVEAAAEMRSHLIFCSTDTVFDGEHAPYRESDAPRPVNWYAETKIEAEHIVASLGGQAVIARLALVVGLPVIGAGNSFLARLIAALKEQRPTAMPEHEIRTPVDVVTLGRALLEMAATRQSGLVHLSGNERLSRYVMGRRIARRLGFSESLITPQLPAATLSRAPRPRDVSLVNDRARALLKTPLRSFDEALDLILAPDPASAL